jgi:nicotinamidase-related amidase
VVFFTNFCVKSTSRIAYDRGYGVTVIKDATAANSEEEQNHSEQKIFPLLGQTLSVDQFISQLEADPIVVPKISIRKIGGRFR